MRVLDNLKRYVIYAYYAVSYTHLDVYKRQAMEGVIEGEKRGGRKRMKLTDNIKIRECYEETKRLAWDRTA